MKATGTETRWKRALLAIGVVFLLFVLQHYFRRFGQPIETIYFTILFDSIALTGVVLIGLSYLLGPLARLWPGKWETALPLRKHFGLAGLGFVVLHILLALTIFNPNYYPKFFSETGKLSAIGELSILAGGIGFVLFLVVATTSIPSVAERMQGKNWLMAQRIGLMALIISTVHFAILKWRGWFDLSQWYNGIPSGTFVTTLFVVFVFVTRLIARLASKPKR